MSLLGYAAEERTNTACGLNQLSPIGGTKNPIAVSSPPKTARFHETVNALVTLDVVKPLWITVHLSPLSVERHASAVKSMPAKMSPLASCLKERMKGCPRLHCLLGSNCPVINSRLVLSVVSRAENACSL